MTSRAEFFFVAVEMEIGVGGFGLGIGVGVGVVGAVYPLPQTFSISPTPQWDCKLPNTFAGH